MKFFFNKRADKEAGAENKPAASEQPTEPGIDPQTAAVIALAIHQYMKEVQQHENAILTFNRIMKPYSPWSSKIYGIRQQPLHIPGLRQTRKTY